LDPARSPDDSASSASNDLQQGYSSSATGLDSLLPKPDDDQPGKRKKKNAVPEPDHQETASEDINVGKYYLDNKDWKAALSRFQSAMVLDPDEPDVYWGLAESDRHLGNFADARAYYQKVVDYDPDSRHGKDARKALKDPQIANAQKPSPGQQPSITQK
jgi:tetratricopeptide (TPR) repeat protein